MLEVNLVASQEMVAVSVSARTLILVTGPGGTGMGEERWVRTVEWVCEEGMKWTEIIHNLATQEQNNVKYGKDFPYLGVAGSLIAIQ